MNSQGIFRLSYSNQFLNVKIEIDRAYKHKMNVQEDKADTFVNIALKCLKSMLDDPKNQAADKQWQKNHHIEMITEYFRGENKSGRTVHDIFSYSDFLVEQETEEYIRKTHCNSP